MKCLRTKAKRFFITVGEPIPYTMFDNTRTTRQWAEYVKEKSYSLAKINKQ